MWRNIVYTLGLLSVSIFMNSCIVAVVDYREPSPTISTGKFHKAVSFDPGGTLSLENFNGDIEVLGWDKDEVEVYAEKMLPLAYGQKIRLQPAGRLKPKIDFDRFEEFIKIKTIPGGRDEETAGVNYYLNVPHSINLKDIVAKNGDITLADFYGKAFVELQSGNINVENFSGSLTASVNDGTITASLYDLRAEDEIRITVKKGDITVYLQPEVNARIEASAPNGNISSDFDLAESLPAQSVSAQVGEGGALVSLSSLNGNIHIKKL